MSNGHYTALVEAYKVLHDAMVDIAHDGRGYHPVSIARYALHQADQISNRNGINQPNPKETNNVTK